LPTEKASKIRYQNNDVNLGDKSRHEEYFQWLKEVAEKYLEVLPKYLS
jgi:hypothetical protein